jgi:condensation domain-containing protein
MSERHELPSGPSQTDKRALLARLLAERAKAAATAEAVPALRELPLSYGQQRLWFAEQLAPGMWAYHVPIALRMRGPLDAAALEAALTEIVARHETLRASFPDAGDGPSVHLVPPFPIRLTRFNAPPADGLDDEARVQAVWRDEICTPFDVAQGPLVRARLMQLAPADHVLFVTAHHLVCDGLSIQVLLHDLQAAYNAFAAGGRPQLPPLPLPYFDFSAAERRRVEAGEFDAEIAYWTERLNGAEPLDLPTDRPRPAHPSHRGGIEQRVLTAPQIRALRAVGQRLRVSLFMTLLAAFKTLLGRYAGQDDVVVGSPVSGRWIPGTEGLIGCFINTVAFRTNLSGDPTFAELVGRVRDTALAAYERRTVPFEKVVEKLPLGRDTSRAPLVQVFFNMVNLSGATADFRDLAVTMFDADEEGAKFDFTLYAIERPNDLLLRVIYATDLFDPATVAEMLQRLERLLETVAADPDRRLSALTLTSEAEESELVRAFNAPLA